MKGDSGAEGGCHCGGGYPICWSTDVGQEDGPFDAGAAEAGQSVAVCTVWAALLHCLIPSSHIFHEALCTQQDQALVHLHGHLFSQYRFHAKVSRERAMAESC